MLILTLITVALLVSILILVDGDIQLTKDRHRQLTKLKQFHEQVDAEWALSDRDRDFLIKLMADPPLPSDELTRAFGEYIGARKVIDNAEVHEVDPEFFNKCNSDK